MDSPIVITPQDIINVVLALCGAIITISGAGTIIIRAIAKAREPNKKQDERLDKVEQDIKSIKERFRDENHSIYTQQERITGIESAQKETNIIIIKSLQALIDHAIDGNNTSKLERCKEQLDGYLIDKAT